MADTAETGEATNLLPGNQQTVAAENSTTISRAGDTNATKGKITTVVFLVNVLSQGGQSTTYDIFMLLLIAGEIMGVVVGRMGKHVKHARSKKAVVLALVILLPIYILYNLIVCAVAIVILTTSDEVSDKEWKKQLITQIVALASSMFSLAVSLVSFYYAYKAYKADKS